MSPSALDALFVCVGLSGLLYGSILMLSTGARRGSGFFTSGAILLTLCAVAYWGTRAG